MEIFARQTTGQASCKCQGKTEAYCHEQYEYVSRQCCRAGPDSCVLHVAPWS